MSSVTKPIPVCSGDVFPIPPMVKDELTEEATNKEEASDDDNFVASDIDNSTKLFNQAALNDLVRDLDLSKEKAELITSRLQKRNMLQPEVTFYWYRHREVEFIEFCFGQGFDGILQ